MSTIGDLSVTSSVSSADKLPVWSNANGVTRGLPISVLDSRYITQDQINLLAISPTPEIFSAGNGIVPNTFVPGSTLSLTLANLYETGDNIDVFFDGTFQGSDQWSLIAYSLVFNSAIPIGVSKVYIKGGAARLSEGPSNGSVIDASVAPGSKLYNRINDLVSVKDKGAKGDGVTDDTAAVLAAIAASSSVLFPAGTYMFSGTLTLLNNTKIVGQGRDVTILKQTTNNVPVITIPGGVNNIRVSDLSLQRSVMPNSAGHGIFQPLTIGESVICDLNVTGQWDGLHLGAIDYGRVDNVISERNFGHGVYCTTEHMSAANSLQWYITNTICQLNGGHGFTFNNNKTGAASVGGLVNCQTFANTGYGYVGQGAPGCPVASVRISSCFFGSDANGEIFLDTYGTFHEISDTFTEAPGIGSTGPTFSTPATMSADCIDISVNNNFVKISDCDTIQPSFCGIVVSASNVKISDCRIIECGQAGVVGQTFGIVNASVSGNLLVQNCQIGNTGTNTFQTIGIQTGSDHMIVIGNDMSTNSVTPINAPGGLVNAIVQGNFPISINH